MPVNIPYQDPPADLGRSFITARTSSRFEALDRPADELRPVRPPEHADRRSRACRRTPAEARRRATGTPTGTSGGSNCSHGRIRPPMCPREILASTSDAHSALDCDRGDESMLKHISIGDRSGRAGQRWPRPRNGATWKGRLSTRERRPRRRRSTPTRTRSFAASTTWSTRTLVVNKDNKRPGERRGLSVRPPAEAEDPSRL